MMPVAVPLGKGSRQSRIMRLRSPVSVKMPMMEMSSR
jgi:hypothetical protein